MLPKPVRREFRSYPRSESQMIGFFTMTLQCLDQCSRHAERTKLGMYEDLNHSEMGVRATK